MAAGSLAVRSQSRAVLSSLPVISQSLSGLIATARTGPLWPRNTTELASAAGSLAVRAQNRAVLSSLPVISQMSSGLIATALS